MEHGEALNYMFNLRKFGNKDGLKNIKTLMEKLGNPQDNLKYIHIAGTNGKGSVAAFTNSVLIEAGYRVGLYTSPYLEKFEERIRINNQCISEEDVARLAEMVKEKVDEIVAAGGNYPTFFEFVTAMAFIYFAEQKCDVVVLEVGLGGRLDSTNIINESLLSVIATISWDHMEYLGDTIEKIAAEKAAIIKRNGDLLLYPQQYKEADDVIRHEAAEKCANVYSPEFEKIKVVESTLEMQVFSYKDLDNVKITIPGEHQLKNAAMVIEAAMLLNKKGFFISRDSLYRGLENAKWPGRFEVLKQNPYFIIDAAHNREGAQILAKNLEMYFSGKKIIFIFGVMRDKEYEEMIKTVAPLAKQFIAVAPDYPRALPAEELAQIITCYCKDVIISDTIKEAVNKCLTIASKDDVICAFGSLYYIGEIRQYLLS